MESKKHLWRCGHQSIKKKRSSKKDSDSKDQRIGDDHHSNLATSLIKFVKKKCSSFNVKKRRKLPSQPHQSQEKKEHRRRKSKKTAAKANAKANKNQLTLKDWMFESAADVSFGNSGEFHVFKQAKKVHPSIERNNNFDGEGNRSAKKSYRSIDQMLEKLESVSGGEEVVEEDSDSPARLSSGETGKKRVRFRLPVVSKIIVLESTDPKE